MDEREVSGGMRELDPQRFEKISELIKRFRKTCQCGHGVVLHSHESADLKTDGQENGFSDLRASLTSVRWYWSP